jgi:hypothetical protein
MMSLLFALTILPLTEVPVTAIEPPPQPVGGLIFKNTYQAQVGALNVGTLLQERVTYRTEMRERGIEYVDHCGKGERAIGHPHTTYGGGYGLETVFSGPVTPHLVGRPETSGWFISKKTLPGPGLRVIVRNISTPSLTTALMPYTDREYDKGGRSEGFIASLQTDHSSRFLGLQSGMNQFAYEIKRGDQVVESGKFTANIAEEVRDITETKTHSRQTENLRCEDIREDRDKDGHKKRH